MSSQKGGERDLPCGGDHTLCLPGVCLACKKINALTRGWGLKKTLQCGETSECEKKVENTNLQIFAPPWTDAKKKVVGCAVV